MDLFNNFCISTLSQAIFISIRTCDLKQDASIAFVDSVMQFGTCTFFRQNKGNFLYSFATSLSIINYFSKALDDGAILILLNCTTILVEMNLLSSCRVWKELNI